MEKEVTIKFDNAQAAEPVKATIDGDEGGVIYSNDKSILTLHMLDEWEEGSQVITWYNNGSYVKDYYIAGEEFNALTKYFSFTDMPTITDTPMHINVKGTVYTLSQQTENERYNSQYLGEYVSLHFGIYSYGNECTVESIMIGYDPENFNGFYFDHKTKTI